VPGRERTSIHTALVDNGIDKAKRETDKKTKKTPLKTGKMGL
jgi:hypothetical protein